MADQTQTQQQQAQTWRGWSVQNILSLFIPGSFIIEIVTYRWWGPSGGGDAVRMIDGLLGLQGGWAAMVVGYHFNSSASSARKDEIIAASAPVAGTGNGSAPPQPPAAAPPAPPAPKPDLLASVRAAASEPNLAR